MSKRMGVGLIPDAHACATLISIRSMLTEYGVTGPVLGMDKNYPHVSLFQGEFSHTFEPSRVLEALRSYVCNSEARMRMSWRPVTYYPVEWLFLLCDVTTELREAQRVVLGEVEPHLVADTVDSSRGLDGLTVAERQSYLRYGYRYVGDAFLPHVTLGRVTEERASRAVAAAQAAVDAGLLSTPSRLGSGTVYIMGPDGAHESTVQEVDLTVC